MALSSNYRKLFIDSRWRSSGDHSDFTIELPDDVDTTRTSSVYLASCSFANTFETVLQGVNDNLFAIVQDAANAPRVTPSNEWLYLLYRRDRLLPQITSANNQVYIMLLNTSVSPGFVLYSATVDPGTYTVEQFATKLGTAVESVIKDSTLAWQEGGQNYAFNYNDPASTSSWWIPNSLDLAAGVARFNPTLWTGTTLPASASSTVNALLNMPRLQPDPALPFDHTAVSGAIAFSQPVTSVRYALTSWPASVTFSDAASRLQTLFRGIFGANCTFTAANRSFALDTGSPWMQLRVPSDAELRSAAWKAANWTGQDYSVLAPASYNASLRIVTPTILVQSGQFPTLPATAYALALRLAKAQYDTGTLLAAALQTALVAATGAGASVAFDTSLGTLTFTAASGWLLQFPTERELRDRNWRAAYWDSVPNADAYSLSDPKSLNGQLYFPSPSSPQGSTLTGNIDMTPYREIYVASSLTNFRTLQSGTGAQDILARVPIDVNYGEIISFRSYTHDALAASDEHFRVLRFRFLDWAGRVVPVDQPVVIELVFQDSDPYSM